MSDTKKTSVKVKPVKPVKVKIKVPVKIKPVKVELELKHGPVDIVNVNKKMLTVRNCLRVRQLLFATKDCEVRIKLRGKVMKKDLPEAKGISPPSPLIQLIKKTYPDQKSSPSSILGIVVEHLISSKVVGELNYIDMPVNLPKLRETVERSKVFVKAMTSTVQQLHKLYAEKQPKYNIELGSGHVTGHPDIVVGTHIYEVKWTTQLKKNYLGFLLQLFTYGALEPKATHLHLVLPAQSTIMTWDLSKWKKRDLYRTTLLELAEKIYNKFNKPNHLWDFRILKSTLGIGHHIGRKNAQKLCPFVLEQQNSVPTQLFLRGNLSTKVDKFTDTEIAKMSEHVINYRQQIFVHAPYSINLCITAGTQDDYSLNSLVYNLQVANSVGFAGVVVHCGTLTRGKTGYSLENMETNVWTALASASEECPLLIETPCREGGEVLNNPEELAEFVTRFHKDCPYGTAGQMRKKIGICIDTCHIFAAGHLPLDYIQIVDYYDQSIIKLIHYNDSVLPLGSGLDRHETPGMGEIPWEQMSTFAQICSKRGIPMITE